MVPSATPLEAAPSQPPSLSYVVRGDFHTTWIYVVGPFIDALIGVAFKWILKGKPTAAEGIAAQGLLGANDPSGQRPE